MGCESGFDGGHTPRYHIEVYDRRRSDRRFHLAHNITRSVPSFHVQHLKPLTDYAVVAYASNSLGREEGDDGRVHLLRAQLLVPQKLNYDAIAGLFFSSYFFP